MIILFFALLDFLAGFAMMSKSLSVIVLYIAYAHLVKGGFSLFGSIFSGHFLDWMGALDVIGGVILLFISANITLGFFSAFGWIMIGKGIYTCLRWLLHV